MIIVLILKQFLNVLNFFFGMLPDATTLPFGVDDTLVAGVGYLRFFIAVFPPFGTLLTAFLIYLGFILSLKVVRLIPIVRHILD